MGRADALFRFDERLNGKKEIVIAGVDEAGRGPLAGPVVAAAVIFRRRVSLAELDDSKKLTSKTRERLFGSIALHAWVGIGQASEEVIDEVNILEATKLAMQKALLALPRTPDLVLIDGRIHLNLPLPQRAVVRGDGRSASIAAASVIAKVYRDHWMEQLDQTYPDYGFARHKGYPTRFHLAALRQKGATEVHRRSFRPVREVLERTAQ